eukprot:scaffold1591_cov109-Isochrysis_galbana.AAC.13
MGGFPRGGAGTPLCSEGRPRGGKATVSCVGGPQAQNPRPTPSHPSLRNGHHGAFRAHVCPSPLYFGQARQPSVGRGSGVQQGQRAVQVTLPASAAQKRAKSLEREAAGGQYPGHIGGCSPRNLDGTPRDLCISRRNLVGSPHGGRCVFVQQQQPKQADIPQRHHCVGDGFYIRHMADRVWHSLGIRHMGGRQAQGGDTGLSLIHRRELRISSPR